MNNFYINIFDLQEELILHILSFLKAKDLCQFSLVSKKVNLFFKILKNKIL